MSNVTHIDRIVIKGNLDLCHVAYHEYLSKKDKDNPQVSPLKVEGRTQGLLVQESIFEISNLLAKIPELKALVDSEILLHQKGENSPFKYLPVQNKKTIFAFIKSLIKSQ